MATARPFVMHGAREILHISAGSVPINLHINAIESVVADSPNWLDLRLMPSLNDAREIPSKYKNLVVLAAVKDVFHFRIFDGAGKLVVETDETKLTTQLGPLEDLRKQLTGLWPPHKLTRNEKHRVIASVTSIVGHTPPNLAFDFSRSLVECVCKTILGDRGQTDCDKLEFKDLLERTYNEVVLVPDSHAAKTELIASIDKILSNLDNVVFSLSDLGHRLGLSSHEENVFASPLEAIQAHLSARAADTVAYFLYMAHKNYPNVPLSRDLEFDDNPDFNEFVDQSNDPVEIFDLAYTPSEVLFSVDAQAYRDKLASFRFEEASAKEETNDELEGDGP